MRIVLVRRRRDFNSSPDRSLTAAADELEPLGHARTLRELADKSLLLSSNHRLHRLNCIGRRGKVAGKLPLQHRQIVQMIAGRKHLS